MGREPSAAPADPDTKLTNDTVSGQQPVHKDGLLQTGCMAQSTGRRDSHNTRHGARELNGLSFGVIHTFGARQ